MNLILLPKGVKNVGMKHKVYMEFTFPPHIYRSEMIVDIYMRKLDTSIHLVKFLWERFLI